MEKIFTKHISSNIPDYRIYKQLPKCSSAKKKKEKQQQQQKELTNEKTAKDAGEKERQSGTIFLRRARVMAKALVTKDIREEHIMYLI